MVPNAGGALMTGAGMTGVVPPPCGGLISAFLQALNMAAIMIHCAQRLYLFGFIFISKSNFCLIDPFCWVHDAS